MSIKAKNISVEIGNKTLLNDVSFEIKSNEILAILGPNGAGKSTLLKTITGEIEPTAGEIFYVEKRLNDWDAKEISKCRGVLPQGFAMSFPFKVSEVTLLGRTPHINFRESKRDFEIAKLALEKVEIADFSDRFYPTLSGGEQKRVQLARVLTQIWEKPENSLRYLFLDEPTASLDLAHQHLTLQTAREFAENETVVITVLHDLNLAAQYADKILILKNGKKATFGKPNEVLTCELIEEIFKIKVYITKHEQTPEIPLIVPIGKVTEKQKSFRANA